ncbi:uncharacterized protein CYBJADRAFT_184445 [Cyberlindnera jadinii NRRL Y-1542]|uniref:IMS import disulfide relay-system CHCH-CHCH-like Cx9C domain-containing protein n=1 Tax=Cyberlindnera jadinii (strain ATCC 18201 / CBS 1600 / BCRC 20928 / JCM 3617 / NBRC 0987 / NRRL Y-1542) TaxID=983966 RepID=A0A1E4S3F7_CYBJN|nr:hypothetical protein CYBJADRAFT_184445 [Cyberlindnera jadinii NRRL Y-1542]ODV74034.1 hypothetical protein CYBJADRAFT_184445 [Cyberlindnera jadinii NRRL Y-1542]
MSKSKYSTRPAKKLISATAQCSESGTVYGECILLHYQNLKKGICEKEFQAFKQCVMKHVK